MHLQKQIQGWTAGLIPGLPQVVKAVDQVQAFREAKQINPQCVTVLRHHYDTGQVFGGTWTDNLERARHFLSTFVDETFREYAPYVDYIEEWNEYLANSQNSVEVADRVKWADEVAEVWQQYRDQSDYAHIRLVLCNTAIGNLIPQEFARSAIFYDAVLGYHPYTYWQRGERPEWEWDNLSGLWNLMEEEFYGDLKPTWIFTEAGPFESAVTGWRSPECLGGNRAAYVEAMRTWYRDVKGTAAYREGRLIGAGMPAIFTSGGGKQWKGFETTEKELVALYTMFAEEQETVAPPPPPEPTPEPEPEPEPAPVEFALMTPTVDYLRVRSSPEISNNIVGRIAKGTQLRPSAQHVDEKDLWVRWGDMGWSAEIYGGWRYLTPVNPSYAKEA